MHRGKVHFVGHYSVADNTGLSSFTIVASQVCEITQNSEKNSN